MVPQRTGNGVGKNAFEAILPVEWQRGHGFSTTFPATMTAATIAPIAMATILALSGLDCFGESGLRFGEDGLSL